MNFTYVPQLRFVYLPEKHVRAEILLFVANIVSTILTVSYTADKNDQKFITYTTKDYLG